MEAIWIAIIVLLIILIMLSMPEQLSRKLSSTPLVDQFNNRMRAVMYGGGGR